MYRLSAPSHAPLLIEAGVAWPRLQKALSFQTSGLAGVLISHAHNDHSRSALKLAERGVSVLCSRDCAEQIGLAGHHNFVEVSAGQQIVWRDWAILPFDLHHDVPVLGFLVASRTGEKLLYITDTSHCTYKFRDVTIAAIEANYERGILDRLVEQGTLNAHHAARVVRNHLSLETAAGIIQSLAGPKLRAVHLLHLSGGNSDATEFQRHIKRLTGVPVHVAPEGVPA